MAAYNQLKDFLVIDGVDLSEFMFEVQITPSIASIENTAGSDEHVSRFPTVRDYSLTLSIRYDDKQAAKLLQLVKPGLHQVLYGIEGNAKGKPKHEQRFLFADSSISGSVEGSSKRFFQISASGAEAPIYDMFSDSIF